MEIITSSPNGQQQSKTEKNDCSELDFKGNFVRTCSQNCIEQSHKLLITINNQVTICSKRYQWIEGPRLGRSGQDPAERLDSQVAHEGVSVQGGTPAEERETWIGPANQVRVLFETQRTNNCKPIGTQQLRGIAPTGFQKLREIRNRAKRGILVEIQIIRNSKN